MAVSSSASITAGSAAIGSQADHQPASTMSHPPASSSSQPANMQQQQQQQSIQALKSSLYNKLSKDGLLSQIKANVRVQLLQQLTKQQQPQSTTIVPTDQHTLVKIPLLQRGINSLIADYLQCNSYNYTYSVFLPEVSLTSSTQLSNTEICSLLKLNEQQIQQILNSMQSSTTSGKTPQSLLTTLILNKLK